MFVFFCEMLAVLFSGTSARAGEQWEIYTNTNEINALAVRGDRIWCGTGGGLVARDTTGVVQRIYTVMDGLPDNRVTALAFDSAGNLWAGFAGAGIMRYNGREWTLFEECGGKAIHGVTAIDAAPEGTVWFSAAGGISRYSGGQWDFYALENVPVYALKAVAANIAWVGTGRGLYRIHDSEWQFIPVGDRADTVDVRALTIDSRGTLWVGADQGLFSWDGEKWTAHSVYGVASLTIDSSGSVWAGSSNLYSHDPEGWRTIYSDMHDGIRALAVDAGSRVWAGRGSEISCWRQGKWVRYPAPGPGSNNLTALALGPDGDIWGGAWAGSGSPDGGVFRYDGVNWTAFTENDRVRCLAVDRNGVVWTGGWDGLFRYDGNIWTRFTPKDGLTDPRVKHIDIGPDGRIWASTFLGLDIYDGTSWTNFRKSTVQFVEFTKSGEIWIAYSSGGLGHYTGSAWIGCNQIGELPQSISTAMAVAPDDATWIAACGGICRVKDGKWTTYPLPDDYISRQIYNIRSMAFDRQGKLWCVIDGGLYTFENGTWSTYPGPDWLKRVPLTSIAISPDGTFWMCSRNEGIYRMTTTVSTHAEEDFISSLPLGANLGNHPNPFNPSTTIAFTLPSPGRAALSIYDITGRKVRTLLSGSLSSGSYSVVWDGRDDSGRPVSSGLYFSRLSFGKHTVTGKMTLVK